MAGQSTAESVADELLDAAVARGERLWGVVRLIACVLLLVQTRLFLGGTGPAWQLETSVMLFAIAASAWLLAIGRTGLEPYHLALSLGVDRLLIFVGLAVLIAFPPPAYPGFARVPEVGFFFINAMAAGLRLSPILARVSAVGDLVLLSLLAGFDYWRWGFTHGANMSNLAVVFLLMIIACALSVAFAVRTRRLVLGAAEAAMAAGRARARLGAYVSEEVAALALDVEELSLGGVSKEVTILFSDIRGFTSYTEDLSPERTIHELNDYLEAMVAAIRAEGGVVDKYIGDAIMAVWGAPHPSPEDAGRAIRAAMGMDGALVRLNEARVRAGLPPLRHGIGVHSGAAIAGHVGTAQRLEYTVIGDAVNTASRLEGATKDQGCSLLMSEASVMAARATGTELPPLTACGSLPMRGRAAGLTAYKISG